MRDKKLSIHLTENELNGIRNISNKLGLSISGFSRCAVLKAYRQEKFVISQCTNKQESVSGEPLNGSESSNKSGDEINDK